MPRLRFKVHAILQMEERGITVEYIREALDNGDDIESRPDEHPYPARLVLGLCAEGTLHVAVRDNLVDDETIVETAYWPDPPLGARPPDASEEDLMKCIVCHHGETVAGVTTVTFDRVGSTIVVRSVPAEVCENCGEAYVAEDVTESLLEFVRDARNAGTEVLIREYTPAA